MSDLKVLAAETPRATSTPERLSWFQRVADKVSYGMGTPTNITIWIVLVAAWIAMGPYFAKHSFLPSWFTSNGFNFPLNTVTTIAELYIGFLVGASSNRSERNLETTLGRIGSQEEQIRDVEDKLTAALEQNTKLTEEVHKLTKLIHEIVSAK
jgi:low affinity Fe/Cu permease